MKNIDLSNLRDMLPLPSGAGVQILNRNGKDVYQIGFCLSGVRSNQSDLELELIERKLCQFLSALPPGTDIKIRSVSSKNFHDDLIEYDERIEKFSQNPEDRSKLFFVEQDRGRLVNLLNKKKITKRTLTVLLTYVPSAIDAQDIITATALKVTDWFYTAFGGASKFEQVTKSEMERLLVKIDEFRRFCFSGFSGTGMSSVQSLTVDELWAIAYSRNHPNTVKELGVPAFPYRWRHNKLERTPREVVWEKEPVFASDHVKLDGSYVGAVVLRQRPAEGEFPFTMANLLSFEFEYEVVVHMFILNRAQARAKLNVSQNLVTSNLVSSGAVKNVDAGIELDEIEELQSRISSGRETFANVSVVVLPMADTLEELKKYCSLVETEFGNMGDARGLREQNDCWAVFLATAPDSCRPMIRPDTHSTSRATVLVPFNRPKEGDKVPLISFPTPTGEMYKFNPYDPSNTNFNGVIFGESGCGKSTLTAYLLSGAITYAAVITILDVGVGNESGGTYKPLCTLMKGAYTQFNNGKTSLNPFEISSELILGGPGLGGFDPDDMGDNDDPYAPLTQAQVFLQANSNTEDVLLCMVNGGYVSEKDISYSTRLGNAIKAFYQDSKIVDRINKAHRYVEKYGLVKAFKSDEWKNYPILKDFIPFIEVRGTTDDIGNRLVDVLSGSYCSGLKGAIFNRPSTVDQENKFLVFDLKEIDERLLPSVVSAAIGCSNRRNYKHPSQPKFSIGDEFGEQIKIPAVARQFEQFYTTARKNYGSAWIMATSYEQIMGAPCWPGIKDNAKNKFIGAINSGAVEVVAKELKIPIELAQQLSGPGFQRNRQEGYSTWLHIKNSNEFEIVRNQPPQAIMWMNSNERPENDIKSQYMKAIPDPYAALTLLACDYPRYAEGGLHKHIYEGKETTYLERYVNRHNKHYAEEMVNA
jgi:TraG P-loop domain